MKRRKILIVDDELSVRESLREWFSEDGFEVETAEDGNDALSKMQVGPYDIIVIDLKMPGMDGITLQKRVREIDRNAAIVILTAYASVDTAVEALKLGAYDYVTKPVDPDDLSNLVKNILKQRDLSEENVRLKEKVSALSPTSPLIGNSPAMNRVMDLIQTVAETDSTVLIPGESGTGKELIARALHENSSRRDKPFIRVNCAAIPQELIESELFGYEKGAFTGAVTSKPGRFELANEGTLFLDEIGEIGVNMQVKLLRVLQEQEFERVGGIKTIGVDVRLVAATNRDLAADVGDGRFREDLYYRLNVVHLHLPPLRERTEDVPLLIEHFLGRFNERLSKDVKKVSKEALEKLEAYPWRGNIRELENVVERCVLFADGEQIEVDDLPPEVRTGTQTIARPKRRSETEETLPGIGEEVPQAQEGVGLKETVREMTSKIERKLIVRALEQTGSNVTRTARLLKISRKSLQTKMKELGLREEKSE